MKPPLIQVLQTMILKVFFIPEEELRFFKHDETVDSVMLALVSFNSGPKNWLKYPSKFARA